LDADAEFAKRLLAVPTAVENMYFGYMLLLCAVREAAGRIDQCDFGTTRCAQMLTGSASLLLRCSFFTYFCAHAFDIAFFCFPFILHQVSILP
jgi:hypothetical protein